DEDRRRREVGGRPRVAGVAVAPKPGVEVPHRGGTEVDRLRREGRRGLPRSLPGHLWPALAENQGIRARREQRQETAHDRSLDRLAPLEMILQVWHGEFEDIREAIGILSCDQVTVRCQFHRFEKCNSWLAADVLVRRRT